MWPYNDDESRWLDTNAPARLVPADQITPELIAYHERRARQLRSEAMAQALGGLSAALRRSAQPVGTRGDRLRSQRLPGHWPRGA